MQRLLIVIVVAIASASTVNAGEIKWRAARHGKHVAILVNTRGLTPLECVVGAVAVVTVDGVDVQIPIQPRVLTQAEGEFTILHELPAEPKLVAGKMLLAAVDDCRVYFAPPDRSDRPEKP